MVCAGEATGLSQSRRSSGLEIGCLIDTDTGLLTFTSNGVEMSTFFQVGLPRNYLIGKKWCLSYSSKFPISLFPFSFHKYKFYTKTKLTNVYKILNSLNILKCDYVFWVILVLNLSNDSKYMK